MKSDSRVLLLLCLAPGLGVILLAMGSVVVMAAAQSLGYFNLRGDSGFTTQYWSEQLQSRQLWRSFFYSLKIATLGSIGSVILAFPLAIWLRRPFPGSLFISAVLKAPYLVHGLVAAFLLVNVISFHGFFNEFMVWIGLIDRPIRMQNDQYGIAIVFLQIWKGIPFALIVMSGPIQGISDDILYAAQDLGAGAFDRFRRIIAPLSLQAMQAALVIIFIGAAGDFSFQVIAGPTSESSMAQYMVRTKEIGGDWNSAAVIAVMLMALALIGSLIVAVLARLLVRIAR